MTVLEEPDEGLVPTLVLKHPDIGLAVKNPHCSELPTVPSSVFIQPICPRVYN